VNYSELLQLAKSWSNFISDRVIIWRLHFCGFWRFANAYLNHYKKEEKYEFKSWLMPDKDKFFDLYIGSFD